MRQSYLSGGVIVLRATARPATCQVVAFIDEHRDRFGVEPIFRLLTEHRGKIAPSGYYAFNKSAPYARGLRDRELVVAIERVLGP